MREIILADRYNTHEIIKEEREKWVNHILTLLGLDEQELREDNSDILMRHDIQVWNHLDNGDVEILQNNVLVGKWYNPILHPKTDEKNLIFYEIHLDYDSIFDNEFCSGECD